MNSSPFFLCIQCVRMWSSAVLKSSRITVSQRHLKMKDSWVGFVSFRERKAEEKARRGEDLPSRMAQRRLEAG